MLCFFQSSNDSGDVEEVKAEEEDEVWDNMETVTEKTKKRAVEKDEAAVSGVDGKKKRKQVKK